jgi:hypothetical protein
VANCHHGSPSGYVNLKFKEVDMSDPSSPRSRPSPWGWLLLIPVVVPLITTFYNANSPRFLGFPRFYWLQLAYIILGVGTTTVVYQMTKKRR